jgi:hypothetical protein
MKVPPIYTKKVTNCYHNNDKCKERNNIETENIMHGTGGYSLCISCKRLHYEKK